MRNTVHGLELRAKSKYNFERDEKFEKALYKLNSMLKGKIEHARIFGDFFGEGDVTELENALIGRYMIIRILKKLWKTLTFIIISVILRKRLS